MTSWKAEHRSGREGRPGSGKQKNSEYFAGEAWWPQTRTIPLVWGSWAGCVIPGRQQEKTGLSCPSLCLQRASVTPRGRGPEVKATEV